MRPSTLFFFILGTCVCAHLLVLQISVLQVRNHRVGEQQMRLIVQRFGLSDICIATDARYIRHLSISDPVAPHMDHPGAIEHFPTGSFWGPVY